MLLVSEIMSHRAAVAACLRMAGNLGSSAPNLAMSKSCAVVCNLSQWRQAELHLMPWPLALLQRYAAVKSWCNPRMVLAASFLASADMVA